MVLKIMSVQTNFQNNIVAGHVVFLHAWEASDDYSFQIHDKENANNFQKCSTLACPPVPTLNFLAMLPETKYLFC